MSRPVADLVKHVWTGPGATGTGTMTLGAASPGFFPFPPTLHGQVISYAIDHENGAERETGIGTYTHHPSTPQLSRDFITASTAGAPSKQPFTPGNKFVRLTALGLDVVENRDIVDPGLNDDISLGYIAGRSRWLNTATKQIFFCVDHTDGAAVWLQLMAPPVDAGTFNPALIDLSRGQVEYNSYVQTGPTTLALDPAKPSLTGGSVSLNIIGGGFPLAFTTPFVGVEGVVSDAILQTGVSYPVFVRFAPDWEQIGAGLFADRVLVGIVGITLDMVRGGGATINQVAGSPGPYEFAVGGQYNPTYTNPKHAYLKVLGSSDINPLTATMYIALPDPLEGPEGHRLVFEKADTSTLAVVGVGFDNPVAVASVDVSADTITFTDWTPASGDPFILRRGSMPSPLIAGQVLFARNVGPSNTCEVALTSGGPKVDILNAGASFVAFKGRKTLNRQDQFQGARIVGTTTKKWEKVEGGQQAMSGRGQDVVRSSTPELEISSRLIAGLTPVATVTGPYNVAVGTLIPLSGGGYQVTLPATPSDNASVAFVDDTASGWAANPITILRNSGQKIGGVANDILLDRDIGMLVLRYSAATGDWKSVYTAAGTVAAPDAPTIVSAITISDDADAVLAHVGPDRVVVMEGPDAVNYTLHPFATSGIPVGSIINLDRRGAGDFNIVPVGVTLAKPADRQAKVRTAETGAYLYHDPLNTWRLRGDLVAV